MKKRCDLHTHSCFSDGTCTPAEIVKLAIHTGLSAVALTDHNTLDGLPDFLSAAKGNDILAIPGVEIKIDNPGENGIGEIIARGENVMLGYYNAPELTAEVIKDGWFYTGDMGRMDKDGFIFISGRKKNVIVLSNGKNVFPEEIESLVNLSPAIKECVVYAEGDNIKCKIVVDTNYEGDAKSAIENHIASVNEKLIHYKQIGNFTIQEEEMQKTTTGKIKRYVK